MADMTTIKGRIAETIYPNGKGAITAESHQALLLEMVDDINAKKADKEEVTTVAESVSMLSQEVESNRINLTESINALEQKVDNLPQGGGDFDPSGTYPDLVAGDLAGRGESVPAEFGFRASGGKSIKDGRAYIKRIKGNSVVWNQLFDPNVSDRSYEANGVHVVDNRDGSYTIWTDEGGATQTTTRGLTITHNLNFSGHKLLMVGIEGAFAGFGLNDAYSNSFVTAFNNNAIVTASKSGYVTFSIYVASGTVIQRTTWKPRVIDLTKAFPNDWQNINTIEEFNARVATICIEDTNAYNEGEVIHCNTESIKSVGDNAWDEEWEVGNYHPSTGGAVPNPTRIRSKNAIRIIGSESYYLAMPKITSAFISLFFYDAEDKYISSQDVYMTVNKPIINPPQGAEYMRLSLSAEYGTTYKHDILISLYHSGWKAEKDDQYQPYWQDTLPLPIIRKYFSDGMKSAGSANDEIRFNKATNKWEYSKGKIKSVDLGTLNWFKTWYTENEKWRIYANLPSKVKGQNNLLTKKYVTPYTDNGTMPDISITGNDPNSYIYIKDSSYSAQGADALIASLHGVILYYESNDWEWVELDAEDQNFRDFYQVADFGTEQSQSSVPSAAFSADIIYQFNAVDMIREHELEITELQSIIATMQAQLTSLINGGQ